MAMVPKQVGLIVPDRFLTRLKYWKSITISLAAANAGSVRFSPSNAFDVDPLLGSTSMSGFAEFAAFYGTYRALVSSIKVEVTNPSTTSILDAVVVPLNLDPGATPPTNTVLHWQEQPYAVQRSVALLGSPLCTLNCEMSTERIYGSDMVYYDDNFAALVTTSPTNNWWWAIGLYSLAVIPTAIPININIEVGVEFYDRLELNS
jgi:hypothetical protein